MDEYTWMVIKSSINREATFSAIWYGLDTVTVADVKEKKFNSKTG